jgi:CPA2 family monovalent cation:H+ antiporter-2
VGAALRRQNSPFLVIEDADKIVNQVREAGTPLVVGNAAKSEILTAANLAGARLLIVAIPNAFEAGQIVNQARLANPTLQIIARAHSDAEVEHLTGLGANIVIMGEREIARGMIEQISLNRAAAPA